MKDFSFVDTDKLLVDINNVKKKLGKANTSDLIHLIKLDNWCNILAISGFVLLICASYVLTTISIVILSTVLGSLLFTVGMLMKWVIVAHPVLHGAYDNIPGVPKRLTKSHFAKDWRRNLDMFSWIHPLAWEHEHNKLHHGNLGTVVDPDTPLNKFLWNRSKRKPTYKKYINVFYHACISGFNYYAKETIKVYNRDKTNKLSLFKDSILPHLLRYIVLFLILSLNGLQGILVAISSILLIEVVTNILAFFVISATHTGGDTYKFIGDPKNRGEVVLREILGTVNYTNGNDFSDFCSGFLGYHMEHHVLPNETHLFYRKMQPELERICIEHKIPYKTESMFKRFKILLDNYTGQCIPTKAKTS